MSKLGVPVLLRRVRVPPEPLRQDSKELITDRSFEPGIMPALFPLHVLELRKMGLEALADSGSRMRIGRSVQHDDGHSDPLKGPCSLTVIGVERTCARL